MPFRTLLCTLAAAVLAAACSSDSGGPPAVGSVTVTAPATTLAAGETLTLSAAVADARGRPLTGRTLTWSSSDEAVAQVSGGVVTGRAAGQVVISAHAEGRTGEAHLTVTPAPVASVQLSASRTTLQPGETVQLSAALSDARGNPLTGRAITWSSSDTTRIRVNGSGLATAALPGSATVTALSEGRTGTLQLAVDAPGAPPVILSVTPAQLSPGSTTVITGYNFDASAAGNTVTIRGAPATVLAAAPTQLTVRVPCVTPGSVAVAVSRNGQASEPFAATAIVTARSVSLGEALLLTAGEAGCNQLTATADSARYLVVVFNDATAVSALTDFRISGDTPAAAGGVVPVIAPARATTPVRPVRDADWVHDSVHHTILERERALYEQLRADAARMPAGGAASGSAQLPELGEMRSLFYNFGGCTDTSAVVRARAIYVGSRSIIWEDSANALQSGAIPQLADSYQRLGTIFDQDQYRIVRDNFGDPLRRDAVTDNDGRIHMVFTHRLNGSGAAAYVTSCDQYPRSLRPASNFGEYFYGFVPTSTAANPNSSSTLDGWFPFMARTVVHEVKHIASMAARVANGAPAFEQSWLEEGTARHAEELWVRADLHKVSWRGGTGFGAAADNGVFCDFNLGNATCNGLDPLRRPSYGMRRHFHEIRVKFAEPWAWSPYGTGQGQTGSWFYQTAWSLVRYTVDRYASSEAAFFTALTNAVTNGVANLSTVAGAPMDRIIANWGLALYADGYPGLTDMSADIRFPTWNLRSIYAGLNGDPFWFNQGWNTPFVLAPTALPAGAFTAERTGLRGGAHAYYEIALAPLSAQLIGVAALDGQAPSPNVRVAIARIR